MLARTTAYSTAGLVLVVFGSLVAFGPRGGDKGPMGDSMDPFLLGLGLMLVGCALGAYVWYRNVRADRPRPDTPSRMRGI